MKTLILLLFVFPLFCFSQEIEVEKVPNDSKVNFYGDEIYTFCGSGISYPGGNQAFQKFIREHLDWTLFDIIQKELKVYVMFIVSEEGSISELEVVRGISKEIDFALIELFLKMPNWIPAETNGVYHKTRVRVPISFEIK